MKLQVLDTANNYDCDYEQLVEKYGENYADALTNVASIEDEECEITYESIKRWFNRSVFEDFDGSPTTLEVFIKFLVEQEVIEIIN